MDFQPEAADRFPRHMLIAGVFGLLLTALTRVLGLRGLPFMIPILILESAVVILVLRLARNPRTWARGGWNLIAAAFSFFLVADVVVAFSAEGSESVAAEWLFLLGTIFALAAAGHFLRLSRASMTGIDRLANVIDALLLVVVVGSIFYAFAFTWFPGAAQPADPPSLSLMQTAALAVDVLLIVASAFVWVGLNGRQWRAPVGWVSVGLGTAGLADAAGISGLVSSGQAFSPYVLYALGATAILVATATPGTSRTPGFQDCRSVNWSTAVTFAAALFLPIFEHRAPWSRLFDDEDVVAVLQAVGALLIAGRLAIIIRNARAEVRTSQELREANLTSSEALQSTTTDVHRLASELIAARLPMAGAGIEQVRAEFQSQMSGWVQRVVGPHATAVLLERSADRPPGATYLVETGKEAEALVVAVASTEELDASSRARLGVLAQSIGTAMEDVRSAHRADELSRLALRDSLTGLANRRLFRDRLDHALARSRRGGLPVAVALCDLDDFKGINDTLGHAAGDQVLANLADRLRGAVRQSDTVARLGGDEFAVILDPADAAAAERFAERFRSAMALPMRIEGRELAVGVSLGMSVSARGETAEALERDADIALYHAKDRGKGCASMFHPSMREAALHRINSVEDLSRGIGADEFTMFYQPIVDLRNGQVGGIEALARWNHPHRGLLPPGEFINTAEDSGEIVRLGRALIRKAIEDVAVCHQIHGHLTDLRLTVNLSPRQMADASLIPELSDTLTSTGVNPELIIVEITESVLMPGDRDARHRLSAIRDLGLGLYIDDFGTGWSSLQYLRTLPVNGLKLAREFVTGLPNPDDASIAGVVRDLSENLKLDQIIAEGIETEAQREALIDLGYTLGQGYLLGPPEDVYSIAPKMAAMTQAEWQRA